MGILSLGLGFAWLPCGVERQGVGGRCQNEHRTG